MATNNLSKPTFHLRKSKFKTLSIASDPLKQLGTILLYLYLVISAIYEGSRDDLNERKEKAENCSCEMEDKDFYKAFFYGISAIWIVFFCYEFFKNCCQRYLTNYNTPLTIQ